MKFRIIILVLSIGLSLVINIFIFNNSYFPFLVFLWILSIALLISSSIHKKEMRLKKIEPKKIIIIGLLILLPIFIRLINLDANRIHDDEFITAYYSANYDIRENFFSVIPKDKGDWVAQFPVPYFALQKLFFMDFGENFLTIKLSVLPYIFIVSAMLYLLTKKILDERTAILAVIIYAFLPISVYLETLGLHFITSTAVFMVFLYLLISNFRRPSTFNSIMTGVFCGFCYLFYLSSYIALPFLLFVFAIQFFRKPRLSTVKHFFILIVAFSVVLSPFLTYAFKFNPYFTQRYNQVNILQGEWSTEKEKIKQGESPYSVLKNNFLLASRSLFEDEIGGHGGYSFGHLAMLEKVALLLFLFGLISAVFLALRKVELLFILFVVISSFLLGVVFTIPPPAYHRLSLAFPFIALLSSIPFYLLFSIKSLSWKAKYILVFAILILFAIRNQSYFNKAVKKDRANNLEYLEDIKVMKYIETHFPKRKVYIAAFPSYAMKKTYYFYNKRRHVQVDFHDVFLAHFNCNEKYVYVILFPDNYDERFRMMDSNGRIIKGVSSKYSLFVN